MGPRGRGWPARPRSAEGAAGAEAAGTSSGAAAASAAAGCAGLPVIGCLLGGELEERAAVAAEGISGDVLGSALRAGGHPRPISVARRADGADGRSAGTDQRRRMIGSPAVVANTWTSPLVGGAAVDATTRNFASPGRPSGPVRRRPRRSLRSPTRSRGRTRTCVVNEPVASETTGTSGVAVIPAGHCRPRGVRREARSRGHDRRCPVGRSGLHLQLRDADGPDEAQHDRAPASLRIASVAVRLPLAVPMNSTCTSQVAPGERLAGTGWPRR